MALQVVAGARSRNDARGVNPASRPPRAAVSTALAVLLTVLSPLDARADLEQGVTWLRQAQDPATGAWSSGSPALAARDTTEALELLLLLGFDGDANYDLGLLYLEAHPPSSVDLAARHLGVLATTDLGLGTALLAQQNSDDGWGLSAGFGNSDVRDTALVMQAFYGTTPQLQAAAADAVGLLIWVQHVLTDGGFGEDDNESDIVTTAEALRAYARYELTVYTAGQLPIVTDDAAEFLRDRQQPDGSFWILPVPPAEEPPDELKVLQTALAMRALLEAGREQDTFVTARQYLADHQSVDGNWGEDPFTTAVALDVLRRAQVDLSIVDVAFSDSSPLAGDTVQVTVTVRNLGLDPPEQPFEVRLLRGSPTAGALIGSQTVTTNLGASEWPLTFDWDTSGLSGGQQISVNVDPPQAVTEGREDNNTRTLFVTVQPRMPVDLTLTGNDIWFQPERVRVNEGVTLNVTVHNTGDDLAANVTVRFYDGPPDSGGLPLAGNSAPAEIPARESYSFTLEDQSFPTESVRDIYVVIDEPLAVDEDDDGNNAAFRPLVVTEDIDLELTSSAMRIDPSGEVLINTALTVFASVTNLGSLPADDVIVRFYRGKPTSGGTPLGPDVVVGTLQAGESRTVSLPITAPATPGPLIVVAVADPDDNVVEFRERNNQGTATVQVAAPSDLTVFVQVPSSSPTTRGDTVYFSDSQVRNLGALPAKNVRLRVTEGSGPGGPALLPDLVIPEIPGGTTGSPAYWRGSQAIDTGPMAPGIHSVHFEVDPLHAIVEASETNNTIVKALDVRPEPDLAVTEISFDPASPEEGDAVTVQAFVKNLEATSIHGCVAGGSGTCWWKVRIFRGDAATGQLLSEDSVYLLSDEYKTGKWFPLPGTPPAIFQTDGHLGANTFTVQVDPEAVVRDGNRSNNTDDAVLDVVAATRPDFEVTAEDIANDPAEFGQGETVDLSAVVANLRDVDTNGVRVSFFHGDPDASGTEIGWQEVDIPGKGAALASVPWGTASVPLGDQQIYVVADLPGSFDEADEANNKAFRDMEVLFPTSQRPTLSATAGPNSVDLDWEPGTGSTPTGYHIFRDVEILESGAADVDVPRLSASGSVAYPDHPPSHAIDPSASGANATHWLADSAPNQFLEIVFAEKRFLTEVLLRTNWAFGSFSVQTCDGSACTTQGQGSFAVNGDTTKTVAFSEPVRTARIRILVTVNLGGYFRLTDVRANSLAPFAATPTEFADEDLLAGTYTYTVVAVDGSGHMSLRSDPKTATVAKPTNATLFSAAVDGNDVTLSWTASTQTNAVGTYLRRDGTLLNPGNETILDNQTTASANSEAYYNPASLAVDNNSGTNWNPNQEDPAPWNLDVSLPERRYVRQVSLTYAQGGRPQAFTIDTWNGTQFVTRLNVTNPTAPANPSPVPFVLPQPVKTERIRISISAKCAGCPLVEIREVDIQVVQPIAMATASFLDSNLTAGAHPYALTTEDTYRDESDPAQTSATIGVPPAPTGLTATPVGSDVQLVWNSPAPSIVGYRIRRDGQEAGPPGAANILPVQGSTVTSNPAGGNAAVDQSASSSWIAYLGPDTSIDLTLELPAARTMSGVRLLRHSGYSGGTAVTRRVQFWDGAAFVTRYTDQSPLPLDVSPTIAPAVTSSKVRVVMGKGASGDGAYHGLNELELRAPALVAGTAYTDAAVKDGTYSYQVVAVDDAGNESDPSAAASADVGSLDPPTNLAASLSGEQVTVTFLPTTGSFHIYRNGDRLTSTPITINSYVDTVSRLGTYRYWATAVGGTNESGPSNIGTVEATSLPPPSPPIVNDVVIVGSLMRVSWSANAAVDLVANYVVSLDGLPQATVPASGLLRSDVPYTLGKSTYNYTVVAVDLDGQQSAPSAKTYVQPVPQPPTDLNPSVQGSVVTMGYVASVTPSAQLRGYLMRRNGTPTTSLAHVWGTYSASSNSASASLASDTSPASTAAFSSYDETYWKSSAGEVPSWLVVDLQNPPQRVDKVSLSWLSEQQRGVNFDIQAWDGSAFVTKLPSTGEAELQKVYDLPEGVITSRLRILVTETADPTQSIGLRGFMPLVYPLNPPPVRDTAPSGTHSYTMVTEDHCGQRSVPSAAEDATVGAVDLVLAPTDIDFGSDVVEMNENVTVTARVRNIGTQPASGATVRFLVGSLAGPQIGSVVVNVPAGGIAEASVPWTVTTVTENVYAWADPQSLIAETNEDNNSAGRGPPAEWPERTYFYHTGATDPYNVNLTLFGYSDDTMFVVRDALGTIRISDTMDRAEHKTFNLFPAGAYQAFATHKFSLLDGSRWACGYYAMDQEGRGASRDFYTFVPTYAAITSGSYGWTPAVAFAVFSYTNGNRVVISDADTLDLIYDSDTDEPDGTLDDGEHFSNRLFPSGRYLHIVADEPVSALAWGDPEHVVPAGDGRWVGTKFYTWLPGSWNDPNPTPSNDGPYPSNLYVYAQQNGTSVVIEDTQTHVPLVSATLDKDEMLPFVNELYVDRFVTVTATADVALVHQIFAPPVPHWGPYYTGTAAPGDSGALLGRDLSIGKVNSAGVLAVMSYFDSTVVEATETVFEYTYAPGLTPGALPQLLLSPVGEQTVAHLLDDGGLIDLAQPGGQVGPDTFVPSSSLPRIWHLTSNRPVTVYSGGAIGGADASFRSPIFGSAPDLVVVGSNIELSDVSPEVGDHVSITAKVHNLGENVAEEFTVDVYDGDPALGGKRLRREFVDQLYSDDELVVEATWEAVPGAHFIFVVADIEGDVEEMDETNNKASVVVQTPPNLIVRVEDLEVEPAPPLRAGAPATLRAVVTNDGGRMVSLGDVEFWDGDPAVGGKLIAARQRSFLPGDALEFEVPWDTHGLSGTGTHTVHVIADRQDYVDETIETDNEASIDVEFTDPQAPDLRIAAIVVNPASPYSGATATARVTVENIGKSTGPAPVRLSDGGSPVGDDVLTSWLAESGLVDVTFAWRPVGPGTHTLLAHVDPEDDLVEIDDGNNTGTLDVVVADSQITLTAATDLPEYVTGSTVTGSVTLDNASGARTGALVVQVIDEGDLLMATLVDQPMTLASGPTVVPVSWDSDGTWPAVYRLLGDWREAEVPVADDEAPFTITGDAEVAGSIYPDRLRYGANETAILTSTIENTGTFGALEDLEATVEVFDSSNTSQFSDICLVPDIPPGSTYARESWFPTEVHLPGTYTARLTVNGGPSPLVTDTQFDILPSTDYGIALEGTVSAAPDPVDQGIPLLVSRWLHNIGNVPLDDLDIVTKILDPLSGAELALLMEPPALIGIGAETTGSATFASEPLRLGELVALVQVSRDQRVLWSGFIPFTVIDLTPPVVTINVPACTADDVDPDVTVVERNPAFEVWELSTDPNYQNGDPVTAEGTHVLTVTATDTSGNVGSDTASFIIDRTPPTITITGVSEGAVYSDPVAATVTVSDPNLVASSVSVQLNGVDYVSGTLIDVDGLYTLEVEATDCAGNTTLVTVNFEVRQISGDVAQTFSTKSHVLLLADCPCTWLPGLLGHLVCSAALFDNAQVRNDWRTKLRSGRFNGYFMYRPNVPGTDVDLFGELAEVNWIGEGLIVIDNQYRVLYPNYPYLKEPLGISRSGSTTVSTIHLWGDLVPTGSSPPLPITASGTAQYFTILTPPNTATKVAEKPGSTPRLVGAYNSYAATGKSVTLGWDTETSGASACPLYRDAITAVAPMPAELLLKGVARLNVMVTNTAIQPLHYKVIHTFGSQLSTIPPTTPPIEHIFYDVDPGDTESFEMEFRLPNNVGSFPVTAELWAQKPVTFDWILVDTDTFDLDVDRNATVLSNDIIFALDSVAMSGPNATARTNAKNKINLALTRANAQDAITDTLAAIVYVRSITVSYPSSIRVDLMLLLRTYELRWPP